MDFGGPSTMDHKVMARTAANAATCLDLLFQLSDSIFFDNKATYSGGGVYIVHRESNNLKP